MLGRAKNRVDAGEGGRARHGAIEMGIPNRQRRLFRPKKVRISLGCCDACFMEEEYKPLCYVLTHFSIQGVTKQSYLQKVTSTKCICGEILEI